MELALCLIARVEDFKVADIPVTCRELSLRDFTR